MATKGIYAGKHPVVVGARTYQPLEIFECDAAELQRLCLHYGGFTTYNPDVHDVPAPKKEAPAGEPPAA